MVYLKNKTMYPQACDVNVTHYVVYVQSLDLCLGFVPIPDKEDLARSR